VSEWMPIESAPKDGTMFLAFNGFMGVYSTSFCRSWDVDLDGYEGFPCGFHGGQFGKWDCVPTHWMPLPDPPQ
jgi:hypothetical protein